MLGEVLAIRWNWLLGRNPRSGEGKALAAGTFALQST